MLFLVFGYQNQICSYKTSGCMPAFSWVSPRSGRLGLLLGHTIWRVPTVVQSCVSLPRLLSWLLFTSAVVLGVWYFHTVNLTCVTLKTAGGTYFGKRLCKSFARFFFGVGAVLGFELGVTCLLGKHYHLSPVAHFFMLGFSFFPEL
jgi:hypothetical protein